MNRRELSTALASALALSALYRGAAAQTPVEAQTLAEGPASQRPSYTMLIHPDMVLQDLVGPLTVFNLTMGEIRLVWKDKSPVVSDLGLPITPTHDFGDCPQDADVLFVPGGLRGSIALMQDDDALGFLRQRAEHARFVTSVCTGGLVLGAAGLLQGRRATTHWYVRDLLPLFGAVPTPDRVVTDGRLITGGGVTAGLDFGLTIAAILRGEDWARRVMLTLEYAPEPPFRGGTPEQSDPAEVETVLARRQAILAQAASVAAAAAERL